MCEPQGGSSNIQMKETTATIITKLLDMGKKKLHKCALLLKISKIYFTIKKTGNANKMSSSSDILMVPILPVFINLTRENSIICTYQMENTFLQYVIPNV
jgi:hypothetical protein